MDGLFQRSLENKEKIVIFYIDQENNVTQRFIRVIDNNEESIIAFCFLRKKIRTFKLENILSCGLINRRVGA